MARVSKNKTNWVCWIGLAVLIVLLLFVIVYLSMNFCDKECRNAEFQKGTLLASQPKTLLISSPPPTGPMQPQEPDASSYKRDLRVLSDPLYPPVNRTDSQNFNAIKQQVEDRKIYIPTKTSTSSDEFRLVGYYTCDGPDKDTGNNSWKLFARKIDSNRSTFYMSPTDKTLDIKLPITDDVVASGYRLRDLYDIPSTIKFNSPLLNEDVEYKFIELPKTDLQIDGTHYM